MIKCHFLISFTSGGFLIPLPGGRDVPGSLNQAHLSVVAVLGEGQGLSEALGGFSGENENGCTTSEPHHSPHCSYFSIAFFLA